jgi:predicted phosphodiesterase
MRVAALYDIHGNFFALQAALREVRAAHVDLVVIGGDVLPGPMPRETLDCLLALEVPVRFIHGNGDRLVVTHLAGGDIGEVPESFRDMIHWTARQLSAEQRRIIERWPATHQCDMPELGTILFCHATPRNDTEIFTALTAEERLISVFADVKASVVVCGHTHIQFDRTVAGRRASTPRASVCHPSRLPARIGCCSQTMCTCAAQTTTSPQPQQRSWRPVSRRQKPW